jgi:nonsense-mediated mRNA decay protein 3
MSLAKVSCCLCGVLITVPNNANMCSDCLRAEVLADGGLLGGEGKVEMFRCRRCRRWRSKGDHYMEAEEESAELLALCLRHIRGLSKEEITDASFVWTEPHSMRLKVRLKTRREVLESGVQVEQTHLVEFEVKWRQCSACAREFNNQVWKAVVQVRQKVDHTRALLFLEQKILATNAHREAVDIEMHAHGFDFFFAEKAAAVKLCEWIQSNVACRVQSSTKLVSTDNHSNSASTKQAFCVHLIPLCRGDSVLVPKSLGGKFSGRFALVQKVTAVVQLLDPLTGDSADVTPSRYFKTPFVPLLSTTQLTDFVVLDIEPSGLGANASRGPVDFIMADAEVARERGDFDRTFLISTHLGGRLHPGDIAQGYDFEAATNVEGDAGSLPDIVLVRKKRVKAEGQTRKASHRQQSLAGPRRSRGAKGTAGDGDAEYQAFMQEVEGDAELRSELGLSST